MKYDINQLKAIIEKIERSSDKVEIFQYSNGAGLKFEFRDNSLGFQLDSSIELKPIDD